MCMWCVWRWSGLYPKDEVQALVVDQICDTVQVGRLSGEQRRSTLLREEEEEQHHH